MRLHNKFGVLLLALCLFAVGGCNKAAKEGAVSGLRSGVSGLISAAFGELADQAFSD